MEAWIPRSLVSFFLLRFSEMNISTETDWDPWGERENAAVFPKVTGPRGWGETMPGSGYEGDRQVSQGLVETEVGAKRQGSQEGGEPLLKDLEVVS